MATVRAFRWLAVVAMVIGAATVSPSAGASASLARIAAVHRVSVVRCRTEFGITPGKISVPSTIVVRGAPRSTRGLVAYTNTDLFLLGPANMSCAGLVGADGSASVTVWSRRHQRPHQHSHGDGLTLQVIPACVGCMAVAACPFFPAYASRLGFPCTNGIPSGESVSRPSAHVALFEDPPGVAGDGFPSGGPDPANGIDGIKGRYGQQYGATCTLPQREHAACTVVLNDVLARYG